MGRLSSASCLEIPPQGQPVHRTLLTASHFSLEVKEPHQKIRIKPKPEFKCFFLSFALPTLSEKSNAGSVGNTGLPLLGFASGRLLLVRGMDAEAERHMDVLERPNKGKPASPIRFEKQKTF